MIQSKNLLYASNKLKNRHIYILPLFVTLLLLYSEARSQENDTINTMRIKNISSLVSLDKESINTNLQGNRYNLSYMSPTEVPFYLNSMQLTGSVIINNFHFENLNLIYDLSKDELVCRQASTLCRLKKDMVQQFSIIETNKRKHDFVNISFKTENSELLSGYFEVLFNGKSVLYMKRIRELSNKMKPNSNEYYYTPYNRLYLYNQGHYYRIKNLKKLISTLNLNTDNVKAFIKDKKFSRRKIIDNQLIELMSYLESLN
jgi:hypothetical protein